MTAKLTKTTIFIALLLALALSACGSVAATPARGGDEDAYSGETDGSTGGAGALGLEEPEVPPAGGAARPEAGPAIVDRLVIRTANLSMVVTDPVASSQQISALANSLGGYVVSSYTYEALVDADGNTVMRANITVRVPTAQLDAALAQVRGLAVEVKTENITGQDVTAEYTDLESRLRNLEATEAQLINIMDSATKTEDVLAVFNQLTYIREQIEQIKGQMKYYADSAALSAITIELIPDVLSQPIEVGGWRPGGVAREALEALVRALQGLGSLVIWLAVYVLPLALVFGLPLYLGARFIARRLRPARAKTA